MPSGPAEAEVLDMMDSLSNWGRWSDDDQLGTLNYVTPDVCKATYRQEFQFVPSPLRIIGGTRSLANPLTIF